MSYQWGTNGFTWLCTILKDVYNSIFLIVKLRKCQGKESFFEFDEDIKMGWYLIKKKLPNMHVTNMYLFNLIKIRLIVNLIKIRLVKSRSCTICYTISLKSSQSSFYKQPMKSLLSKFWLIVRTCVSLSPMNLNTLRCLV